MAYSSLQRYLLLLIFSNLGLLCWGQQASFPPPTAINASVAVGQGVGLVCSVVGYSEADPLSITIEKVDPTASSTPVTSSGVTVTLSIAATTFEDAGMYRCTASSTIGETRSETIFFYLAVRDELALVTPPADVAVPPGTSATFSCIFNRHLVVSWLRNGQPLGPTSKYLLSDIGERRLTIVGVTYSDRGGYTCQVTNNDMPVQHSATLSLIPAYEPIRSEGQSGQSLIVTADQLRLRCPVTGVPGPTVVYWQRDIETSSPINVTGRTGGEPFVDSQGRLDFSDAGVEDEGRYRCTAVDELGVTAGHVFFVEVTHVNGFVLWNQWYMILVYCVIAVVILAVVVIATWFSCSVKFNWCVRVKKKVRERVRVRRSERPLVHKTPIPRDEGIDAYAMSESDYEDVK